MSVRVEVEVKGRCVVSVCVWEVCGEGVCMEVKGGREVCGVCGERVCMQVEVEGRCVHGGGKGKVKVC